MMMLINEMPKINSLQKPGGFIPKYCQKSKFLKSLKNVLELVQIVSKKRSYYNIIREHFICCNFISFHVICFTKCSKMVINHKKLDILSKFTSLPVIIYVIYIMVPRT